MFDLSPEKIVVLGMLALVVLGPDRLPHAARTLGKLLHQVRTVSASVQTEMHDALAEPRKALDDAVGDIGLPRSIPKVPNVRSVISAAIAPPAANRAVGVDPPATGDPAQADLPIGGAPLPDDPALN